MGETNDINVADRVRRLIETMDIASILTDPLTRSIEDLLRVSATDVNSVEASVLIRDGGEGDLRFLTAIGEVADQLLGVKVPSGKGIAGFDFSSGQLLAVPDLGADESFYDADDKKPGFST